MICGVSKLTKGAVMQEPGKRVDAASEARADRAEERLEDLEPDESAADEVKGGVSEFVITKQTDSASTKLF
jgi:hypothetical protein